ncbi:MAG: type secretion system protein VirB6 [Sphingomonadales bacterium]|jgi:type IV secretion system protein VirB6|nr:type secretion system protein VirB6 [Sphingomonadales bacterium]
MIAPVCLAPPPQSGFLQGLLSYVDCQAQSIGANGYEALASPGSTLSLVVTGFLTLFVAFLGYRMLFGQTPTVREGVLALLKIGIVLAFATSWAVYRTLVYDVALKGPAEMAAQIGQPAALPGAGGGLVDRMGYTDRAFVQLAILGTGDTEGARAQAQQGNATGEQAAPPPFANFDNFAIGGSRILYLTGAIGALASVRLIAGLLLALGPFFIAFLLFEGTRGLFVGWIRALAAAALGALGTSILLGVELALLEPRLAELIALRTARQPIPGAAIELFVIALVFTLVLLAMLIAAARVALGFRLPDGWRGAPAQLAAAVRGDSVRFAGVPREPAAAAADRSRAAQVADAVAASQRRESAAAAAGAHTAGAASDGQPSRRIGQHMPARDVPEAGVAVPIGQSYRRRTRARISASAGRRDRDS